MNQIKNRNITPNMQDQRAMISLVNDEDNGDVSYDSDGEEKKQINPGKLTRNIKKSRDRRAGFKEKRGS